MYFQDTFKFLFFFKYVGLNCFITVFIMHLFYSVDNLMEQLP